MISPDHRRRRRSSPSVPNFLSPRQPWLKLLRPLLPSFISGALYPEHRPARRLHPTSYLDGLRGIAAIIVFICHYTENNFPALTPSYTLYPHSNTTNTTTTTTATILTNPGTINPSSQHPSDPTPSSWLQLPFARVLYSGRPMVHIFFVISGFALSLKPVAALHARDTARCHAALASSAFRRAFRLFGPCVVSTFMIACLRRAGWLDTEYETWKAEVWAWGEDVWGRVVWPWAWDRDLRPGYDVHLWTVPIEFVHSMLLFLVVLVLSRVKVRVRVGAVLGLMGYCLACGKWAAFEFLTGLFLTEVYVLRDTTRASRKWEGEEEEAAKGTNCLLRVFQVGLIVLGLFIAGWPNRDAERTPGIRYFLAHTPYPFATMDKLAPQKFWFALSAAATVWAVGELGALRRFFETPLAQYCGRISYAVYICHGPVEELFRARILGHPEIPPREEPGSLQYTPSLPATGVKGFIGVETKTQIAIGWFVGLGLLGPLVIWVADVFWRGVDSQFVSLARKLEMACLDDAEPSPRCQGYSAAA